MEISPIATTPDWRRVWICFWMDWVIILYEGGFDWFWTI